MIEPALADDAFLADVRMARERADELHLWWLGQSGFLVQYEGRHLLFDPYLSDSLTQKYAATDKPHVRMTRRIVDPARLDFIDVATSTHNHTDHLDAETLIPLIEVNPELRMVIPEANRDFVTARLGRDRTWPIGLSDGENATVGGMKFTGVAAAHETIERDERGRCKFMGYVVQFGPWTIYHAGDTVLYEGLEAALRPLGIDLALLPINGRAPERRVAGNLNGPEAAGLARRIDAGLVIPCHYEMFEFNTASPGPFAAECERRGQPHRVLKCGERFTVARSSLREAR